MKIGIYSYDVGPINMFKVIAGNTGTDTVICGGVPNEDTIQKLSKTDIVLLGLSAFGSAVEAYVAGALTSKGIPTVFIEDRPGHATHTALKPLISVPKALIVSMEGDVGRALSFGYKQVEYLGPSAH